MRLQSMLCTVWRYLTMYAGNKNASSATKQTCRFLCLRLEDDFDDAYPEELAMEACSHHQTTQHMQAVVYRIESDCVE